MHARHCILPFLPPSIDNRQMIFRLRFMRINKEQKDQAILDHGPLEGQGVKNVVWWQQPGFKYSQPFRKKYSP